MFEANWFDKYLSLIEFDDSFSAKRSKAADLQLHIIIIVSLRTTSHTHTYKCN